MFQLVWLFVAVFFKIPRQCNERYNNLEIKLKILNNCKLRVRF